MTSAYEAMTYPRYRPITTSKVSTLRFSFDGARRERDLERDVCRRSLHSEAVLWHLSPLHGRVTADRSPWELGVGGPPVHAPRVDISPIAPVLPLWLCQSPWVVQRPTTIVMAFAHDVGSSVPKKRRSAS